MAGTRTALYLTSLCSIRWAWGDMLVVVSETMKAIFVQRDEMSAQVKAAELVRNFQARFAKAKGILKRASTMC